jgi:hypothetical protein
VAKSLAVRSSWLRVKRLTPGVPAVVMTVIDLLLGSGGLVVRTRCVATHSGTDGSLGQVQVDVDAVVCRAVVEGGAHGSSPGRAARAQDGAPGLVRAEVRRSSDTA